MLFHTRNRSERRGVACLELAVLLPLLSFLFLAAVDAARLFYQYTILADSARSGALYGSMSPSNSTDTAGIQNAALADTTDLSPSPTVTSTTGTDADGNPCVDVTVNWTFTTIASYPGIAQTWPLSRTVQMRVSPLLPN